jgi:hypothetical protein
MWNTLSKDWNFFRIIRLVLGLAALGQAIILGEWLLAFAGALIAGMALANVGCGPAGCAPHYHTPAQRKQPLSDITYEELDTKK